MGQKLESIPSFTRALMKSHLLTCGFSYEDIQKPIVAIANSWNEYNHGHLPQRKIADKVKDGIRAAGGLPLEFNTIAPCDALAQGYEGMDFVLPSREIIADSVEVMIRSQDIADGIVFISSCDKITPGMLMAALRLDRPCLHIPSGPCLPSISFADSKEIRKQFLRGELSEEEMAKQNAALYSHAGICPYIGTANTMNCAAEVLGLALPGAATAPAATSKRLHLAIQTGQAILDVIARGYNPSKFVDQNSFDNVLKVMAAISGSLNHLLHIPAVAAEMGIMLDFDHIDRINEQTPQLCAINPNGVHSMVDLDNAGGIPAVIKELGERIHGESENAFGDTFRDVAARAVNADPEVIRPLDRPLTEKGGIVVLTGNIARYGAAVRRYTIPDGMTRFEGPAMVFDGEEAASAAIESGEISEGQVVVVRFEGPRGGPGMREMHRIAGALNRIGSKVALITDGRYSGATGGLAVGYLSPEAAAGGEIALLKNGDPIVIDVEKKTLDASIDEAEWRRRRETTPHKKAASDSRLLRDYALRVGPTYQGAVRRPLTAVDRAGGEG